MSNKILIIDDDADTRNGLKIRLRAAGYQTVFGFDAVSAISTARKEEPDLILLDLGLPAGDGLLVLERLSAFPDLAGIPVIVLSARDPIENRDRALAAGASEYYQKPVENEVLLRSIASSLVGA